MWPTAASTSGSEPHAALCSSSIDESVKEQQDDRPQRGDQDGPDVEARRPGTAEKPCYKPPDRGTRHPDESGDDEAGRPGAGHDPPGQQRSEENTSELKSRQYLVCRLL